MLEGLNPCRRIQGTHYLDASLNITRDLAMPDHLVVAHSI